MHAALRTSGFSIFTKVAAKCVSHIFAFLRLARPDSAKPVGDGGNWHGLAVYETSISAPLPPPHAVVDLSDVVHWIMIKLFKILLYSRGVAFARSFGVS